MLNNLMGGVACYSMKYLRDDEEFYNTASIFVKVQNASIGKNALVNSPKSKSKPFRVILGSSGGAVFCFLLIVGACFILFIKFIKVKEIEEKVIRLLVYEFMPNGSLDKWIFCRKKDDTLGWLPRKGIILDVAKGLAYLHEECRQKIVHLDIKPQNILLNENFEGKSSDFGLSKLIDKDQNQVVTTMTGTLGYMAPEWLSSVITEKVDVYSFGVMVLEILCRRKNLDRSSPEEDAHLLGLIKRNAENGDFRKRPSISHVIKALEGTMEFECNLDYDFTSPPVTRIIEGNGDDAVATPMLPSFLSGPR
ncbi:hypothetical protein ACH5RR_037281 [Cinchona calisaya]|uniref:non-specific serine/threonine protein kinase n=1 Tax=Cinchona calisaya TaxID=153742 RepID=A0ABD2YAE6_9GENT